MTSTVGLTLLALAGIPFIRQGDDLSSVIWRAVKESGLQLVNGDLLVVAQKIVSKAEGRQVSLASVTPSARAVELAGIVRKDPRLVELVLSELTEIVACKADVLIVAHRLGFVMANAGIDQSNVGDDDSALLLPIDPDESARRLREAMKEKTGANIKIIINDSFGRAWRVGTTGHAIGVSGFTPVKNYVGRPDLFGRKLRVTEVAAADELAAAASFLMGQADEGAPVVLVRGANLADVDGGGAGSLIRPKSQDLFR